MTSISSSNPLFSEYFQPGVSYTASEVDAVIGYFLKRGFDEVAAVNTAAVLLQQAKKDRLNVQKLIDTLEGTTDVLLSRAVAQILNVNRQSTSQIGYKTSIEGLKLEQRNVVP